MRAKGIGHHSDNDSDPPGCGIVANISDRTLPVPSPAPKNSPSGESTMVRPSNSTWSRNPVSSSSVGSGSCRRSAEIMPDPVDSAIVAPASAGTSTTRWLCAAVGAAGLGSVVPAARRVAITSSAGSEGEKVRTPSAVENRR